MSNEENNELELVKSESFGAVECNFFRNQKNEIYMTIDQLAEALEYSSKNAIDNMLRRNEYLQDDEFSTTHSVMVVEGSREVTRNRIIFTEDGIYEITMLSSKPKAREFRAWARKVIKEIRKTGTYSVEQYDTDYEDIAMLKRMVDTMEANRKKADQALEKSEKLEHRVNNLDATNIDGNLRQRLNAMIRKYALDSGKPYGVAWGKFYQNYNRAYSTNLKLRITNYKKRTGEKITAPKLLEKDGELKDAVRVVDKMFNAS